MATLSAIGIITLNKAWKMGAGSLKKVASGPTPTKLAEQLQISLQTGAKVARSGRVLRNDCIKI
jgi:hypothetical protein